MEYQQITYPFEGGIEITDTDSYRPPHDTRPSEDRVKILTDSKDLTNRI